MKIRNDFVTNSSSSSFILTFKDEDSIAEELLADFKENVPSELPSINKYFQQLLEDISESPRFRVQDIEEEIIDEKEWEIECAHRQKLIQEQGMSLQEAKECIASHQGQDEIETELYTYIDKAVEKIGKNKVIVEVEHGSGGYGEDGVLEVNILPYLNCNAIQFSHH